MLLCLFVRHCVCDWGFVRRGDAPLFLFGFIKKDIMDRFFIIIDAIIYVVSALFSVYMVTQLSRYTIASGDVLPLLLSLIILAPIFGYCVKKIVKLFIHR